MTYGNLSSSAEEQNLPSELGDLAARLKTLVPRTDRLDRERLIFFAGRASAEADRASPGRWAWPAAFGAMTAVAAALFVMLVTRPAGIAPSSRGELAVASTTSRDAPSLRRPETYLSGLASLSAGDAFRGDIDHIIATKQRLRASEGQSEVEWPVEMQPDSVLTPMAWDQVLNGS